MSNNNGHHHFQVWHKLATYNEQRRCINDITRESSGVAGDSIMYTCTGNGGDYNDVDVDVDVDVDDSPTTIKKSFSWGIHDPHHPHHHHHHQAHTTVTDNNINFQENNIFRSGASSRPPLITRCSTSDSQDSMTMMRTSSSSLLSTPPPLSPPNSSSSYHNNRQWLKQVSSFGSSTSSTTNNTHSRWINNNPSFGSMGLPSDYPIATASSSSSTFIEEEEQDEEDYHYHYDDLMIPRMDHVVDHPTGGGGNTSNLTGGDGSSIRSSTPSHPTEGLSPVRNNGKDNKKKKKARSHRRQTSLCNSDFQDDILKDIF